MIQVFKEAWRISKENRINKKDAKNKALIAKLFNDRYTYKNIYVKGMPVLIGSAMWGILPSNGNAWMCPDCNHIYHPTECSVFTGLQYPKCCKTPAGHRLYEGIKTS